jgi:Tfp pilus tip-associated adhesin PilY1
MSTTTTTKTTAKAPAKTTATRTPAKKAAEPKEGKTYLAAATGRGGKTNVRKVPGPVAFAVDVADPDGRTPAAKAGLIYRFFNTEDAATKFVDRKPADGLDAIIVPATYEEA